MCQIPQTITTTNSDVVVTFEQCPPFQAFRKIPRLNRDIVITEKLDGTNASVTITECGKVLAGARNRYITPGKTTDNFGFAAWVEEHKEELLKLGKGRHYGEWWGKGINANYGLQEKRFSLFNTSLDRGSLPDCVSVVPVLYDGLFSHEAIAGCLERLRTNGSVAVPGYLKPEGIVIYHKAAGQLFKVTLENDEKPKGVNQCENS